MLTLIFIMPGNQAFAQDNKKKKKKKDYGEFEFNLGFETLYDNNILKYSEKYLTRFMNGEDPGRFSIETYDDVILNPSVGGEYTFNVFKKVKSRINASISPKYYIVNDIKNWVFWTVGFRQYLTKRASFKISYSYIPEFYVRNFRDDQWVDVYGYTPITFKPYAFSKDNFEFYIQNTFFKSTRIMLTLDYARYYHNQYYTEYDSKDWLYGINVYQKISKNFRIDGSYTYVTSDAKGYDAAYETPETATGPDATFVEDRFSFGFDWDFPKIKKKRHSLDYTLQLMYRYYSSPYPPLEDPLHAGRYDRNYRMFFDYNFEINKSLGLTIFYNWLMRDTETKAKINEEYVSNEKDYRQDQVGFKLVYDIKFEPGKSRK